MAKKTGGMAASAMAAATSALCLWATGAGAAVPTSPVTLPMSAAEQRNLALAEDWWRIVIDAGHLEFVPKYQAEGYIQHNPTISTGRAAFIAVFSDGDTPTNPIPEKLESNIPLAGGRGEFVWMMREYKVKAKTPGEEVRYGDGFDLLRIENGQIQEHWDVAKRQAGAGPIIYGRSLQPLSSYSTGELTAQETAARDVAVEAAETVFLKHDASARDRLFSPDYVEHDPDLIGPAPFAAKLAAVGPGPALVDITPTITLVNGEYVFMMWSASSKDPDDASKTYPWFHYQLIRVKGGKVLEHWDS